MFTHNQNLQVWTHTSNQVGCEIRRILFDPCIPLEKHLKLSLPSESYQSCLSSCKHMQQYKKDQEGKETFLWHEWHEPYSVRHLLSSGLPVYPCDPLCIFVLMQSCVWIPLLPDGLIGRFACGKKVRTLHFKHRRNIHKHSGQASAKNQQNLLYKETRRFSARANLVFQMYIIQFRLYMTLPFVTYIVTYEISTRFLWILDKSGEFKQPGSVAWRTVQTAACPSSMPHEAFQGTRTLLLWQDYLHRRVIAVLQFDPIE